MEITFGHAERERLVFSVPERQSARSKDPLDDCLSANIDIETGGFKGHVSLDLLGSHFDRFLPQAEHLYETLKGEARFETIEGQIGFILKGDGKGHINISGKLTDRFGCRNTLSFNFEFDQTLLKRSISEIGAYQAKPRTTDN